MTEGVGARIQTQSSLRRFMDLIRQGAADEDAAKQVGVALVRVPRRAERYRIADAARGHRGVLIDVSDASDEDRGRVADYVAGVADATGSDFEPVHEGLWFLAPGFVVEVTVLEDESRGVGSGSRAESVGGARTLDPSAAQRVEPLLAKPPGQRLLSDPAVVEQAVSLRRRIAEEVLDLKVANAERGL